MSLLTSFINGLMIAIVILACGYFVWRRIFQCKDYPIKDVLYKDSNLIIQKLKKGKSRTLIVMGNGWNVSLNDNNRITKHDPIFMIPKKELKLLIGGNADYEVITVYFPFECEGIDQSARGLANYLNHNYCDYRIILLGHSKSAVQFAQTLNYLEKDEKKVKLIFVSPAFGGVISDKKVMSTLGLLDRIIYRIIFVPHKVNDDITKGSYFLTKIADFSKISKHEAYLIRSRIGRKPFDMINAYLIHLDRKLSIIGDGIIGYNEQYCKANWTQEFTVEASHSGSMALAIRKMKDLAIL